jgi:HD superfamily phosphohydrolase
MNNTQCYPKAKTTFGIFQKIHKIWIIFSCISPMKNLIHPELQKLHSIYASEFPDFVIPFLSAPALLRLKKIDQNCGSQYSLLCDQRIYYSRLEHSLGVALIVWHFSGDKVQTLSGLFHDISHTVFSHVGDFLLGDAMKQESAELHTTHIIESDPVISCELEKLGIRVDEVDNYELYPIADNPGPRLSADRLEYTLSTALATNPSPATFEKIRKIYNNIHV